MAFTVNTGYDGSVDEQAWASLMELAGVRYAFGDAEACRPTPGGTFSGSTDRTVTVAAGPAYRSGIRSVNDAPVVVQHASVGSGSRWDLCVIRRDYSTNSTSLVIIQGTSTKAIPSFTTGYPVDDQPVYLARVEQGKTAVQEIADLRAWVNTGGAVAADDLARSYLNQLGTCLHIGGVTWRRALVSGSPTWVSERGAASPLSVFGRTGGLDGTPPASLSGSFLVQAGTDVSDTNNLGNYRITFPSPFPNGLLTVMLTNGDDSAANGARLSVIGGNTFGTGSKASVVVKARGSDNSPLASRQIRTNYIAIGW